MKILHPSPPVLVFGLVFVGSLVRSFVRTVTRSYSSVVASVAPWLPVALLLGSPAPLSHLLSKSPSLVGSHSHVRSPHFGLCTHSSRNVSHFGSGNGAGSYTPPSPFCPSHLAPSLCHSAIEYTRWVVRCRYLLFSLPFVTSPPVRVRRHRPTRLIFCVLCCFVACTTNVHTGTHCERWEWENEGAVEAKGWYSEKRCGHNDDPQPLSLICLA